MLWGELAPVPEENVHVVGDRVLGLDCFPTPGHASHHVCYLDRDGTLFAGDAAGVRITPGNYVMPPTPPPELDVGAWDETIATLEERAPERLALIHFGVFGDVQRHLADLRLELYDWADHVRGGASEEEFISYVRAELENAGEDVSHYTSRCRSGSRTAGSSAGRRRRVPELPLPPQVEAVIVKPYLAVTADDAAGRGAAQTWAATWYDWRMAACS